MIAQDRSEPLVIICNISKYFQRKWATSQNLSIHKTHFFRRIENAKARVVYEKLLTKIRPMLCSTSLVTRIAINIFPMLLSHFVKISNFQHICTL